MNSTPFAGGDPTIEQLSAWQKARLTWRLLRDVRVSAWIKAVIPVVALLYLLSPIDAIPDVLLGLGQLDDIGFLGIAVFALTRLLPRLAPRDVVAEHVADITRRHDRGGNNAADGQTVIDTSFRVIDEREDPGPRRRDQEKRS